MIDIEHNSMNNHVSFWDREYFCVNRQHWDNTGPPDFQCWNTNSRYDQVHLLHPTQVGWVIVRGVKLRENNKVFAIEAVKNYNRLNRPALQIQLDAERFLANVYSLCHSGKQRKASDEVFDFFEDNLEIGQFRLPDEALRQAEASKLSSIVLVAMLAVTKPAKTTLQHRQAFLDRTEAHLLITKDKSEVDSLLVSFR